MNDKTLLELCSLLHVENIKNVGDQISEVARGWEEAGDFGWREYVDLGQGVGDEITVVTWTDGVCGQWAAILPEGTTRTFFLACLSLVCQHNAGLEDLTPIGNITCEGG